MRQGLIRRPSVVSVLAVYLVALLLAGCSSAPRPVVKLIEEILPEEPLTVHIAVDQQVNPDVNGRPSPVVLRVYQLKRELQFRSSDFFALYDNDVQVLADDLVGRKEYVFNPGEQHDLELVIEPGVRYVAFLGAFRDLDSGVAKVAAPFDAEDPDPLYLHLARSQVSLLDEDTYEALIEQREAAASKAE